MKSHIIVFFVLVITSLNAAAFPRAFQANYSVNKGPFHIGDMNISLEYKGNTYSYKKSSEARGLASLLSGDHIIENVDGIFNENTMQTSHYLYHHSNKKKNKKDKFTFVSPKLVKGFYKTNYETVVPVGTIDRATMELVLAHDLVKKKKILHYSVAEKGKYKIYKLQRLAHEIMSVAGRDYKCEKIMVARKDSNRKTILWLAEELDYMPVQIQHMEKGNSIMTRLISWTFK